MGIDCELYRVSGQDLAGLVDAPDRVGAFAETLASTSMDNESDPSVFRLGGAWDTVGFILTDGRGFGCMPLSFLQDAPKLGREPFSIEVPKALSPEAVVELSNALLSKSGEDWVSGVQVDSTDQTEIYGLGEPSLIQDQRVKAELIPILDKLFAFISAAAKDNMGVMVLYYD